MDDKRTLLAFLLIGIILLGIPQYYKWVGLAPEPEQQEVVSQGRDTEEASQSAPATPAPESKPAVPAATGDAEPASQELAPVPALEQSTAVAQQSVATESTPSTRSFSPSQITVSTPLQQFTFSSRGGVLTSVQLSQFKQDGRPYVELIPPGGQGLGITVEQGLGGLADLGAVEFVPDRSQLQVGAQEEGVLRLRAQLDGSRIIEKKLTFSGDHYGVQFEIITHGFSPDDLIYLSWRNGISNTETAGSGGDFLGGFGAAQDIGAVAFMNDDRITVDEGETIEEKGALQWAGIKNQYFFLALAPQETASSEVVLHGHAPNNPFAWADNSFALGTRLGSSNRWELLLYTGPLDYNELSLFKLERGLDLGWPIIRDISKVLLLVFIAMHAWIPNYGVVLILFAVAIKILVYPLTHKSYESMAKMQAVQPKITALREKYKNDQQRLSRETMKLYKEEGVNPIGGCLPMLLQMPIFFALYKVFYSIELRQAPFTLWIEDLSLPDSLPVLGFDLHVLPLLMGAAMFFQQKMTMKDPKQAVMVYIMPVFLLFIFWSLPSGLVLYWTVFNVLQIAQQTLVNRSKERAAASPAPTQ
ncbi:MAG: membrane protein insertase YidC [Candidatus Latescibacteria bacterium]|nr:membrane protein insertase YidC [Candidatus Latescibacterota bacterium]